MIVMMIYWMFRPREVLMAYAFRRWVPGFVLCGLALVLIAGCSSGRTPTFPVQGQVRWKGQVPAGAQVVFHPAGGAAKDAIRPTGQVDSEGKFTLTTFAAGDGAPAGGE